MVSMAMYVYEVNQCFQLLGPLVHFPQGKGISLCIQANDKVAHAGNGRLGFTEGSTKFFDLRRCFSDRRNADVVRDRLLRVHPGHQAAIGRGVVAAGVDVPIVLDRSRQLGKLPAEQRSIEFLGPS